jgi:glutaredoxin
LEYKTMSIVRPVARTVATGLVGLLAASAWVAGDANAQQIFRIVGPDGRITFSDQPPAQTNGKTAAVAPTVTMQGTGSAADPTTGIPFELRQVVSRFPVTLYTGTPCAPCASGRAMLSSRGIPFTERTITTPDDFEAIKRLSGSGSLPFLTIGGQQLKGYSDTEWSQYLDAAGYPKTSVLLPTYRPAPPTPLVAVQVAPATPVDGTPAAPRPGTAAAPGPTPPADNPAGIRF